MSKKRLLIAVTGASGAVYARALLQRLRGMHEQAVISGVVLSDTAAAVWKHELGTDPALDIPEWKHTNQDFWAPFASGSSAPDVMIIIPCSMGTLGRIAAGTAGELITRAADVMLKERKRLILVSRETPLNLIHLRNMVTLTEAGAIILPASPSFYSRPETLDAAIATVTDRVLDLTGLDIRTYRWGGG
ncbi:MAG: UbiX family flavin prenyltransferase [Bacteroidales bacterium]|nr:UbiX family flavin prenyltransferase [Bacteroidales bacterium]